MASINEISKTDRVFRYARKNDRIPLYVGNVYFAVTHLTLCYAHPLVVIALCYALICH